MCGIIAYTGKKEAYNVLYEGLKRLQYRGYDSAGMAILSNEEIAISKETGSFEKLQRLPGTTGIAHTRWATHGQVTQENAHPFLDCKNEIAVVHNGIIENHLELKEDLVKHSFRSQTDSEVISHLIEENYYGDLKEAVMKTAAKLKGSYAFCAINKDKSEIAATKKERPLIIGYAKDEKFLASDEIALRGYADKVAYLQDNQTAVLTPDTVKIFDQNGNQIALELEDLSGEVTEIEKGNHKHFMLKEIMEQAEITRKIFSEDINLKRPGRAFLVACGTAYHAALVGRYLFEEKGVEAIAETASEFRYRKFPVKNNDIFIAVSQSGETADTLAALKYAKELGMKTYAIVNSETSTMMRDADTAIPTKAGPEISVASTKAFMAQLAALHLITHSAEELNRIPDKIKQVLDKAGAIKEIALKYKDCRNFLFIGRGLSYPIALEGALKLKEISYIHAEGYPAGEMKHGPIALVGPETCIVAIAVNDKHYEKMTSNIQEVAARKGKVVAIATEGNEKIKQLASDVIFIPDEQNHVFLTTAVMQLIAYYIADALGREVDKPRNLAKSVTVE